MSNLFGSTMESEWIITSVFSIMVSVMISSSLAGTYRQFWSVFPGVLLIALMSLNGAIIAIGRGAERSGGNLELNSGQVTLIVDLAIILGILVIQFLIMMRMLRIFRNRNRIGFGEDYRLACLCLVSVSTLYLFGVMVREWEGRIGSVVIDLALGLGGTWLVAKIVMPWAVPEFEKVMYPYIVEDKNVRWLNAAKIVSALGGAAIILYSVIRGLSEIQRAAARVLALPMEREVAILGLLGLWLFPWLIAWRSAPLKYATIAVPLVQVSWLIGAFLCYIRWTNLDSWTTVWPLWFALASGAFSYFGYKYNSTIVWDYPMRKHTNWCSCLVAANVFMIVMFVMLFAASGVLMFVSAILVSGFSVSGVTRSMVWAETVDLRSNDPHRYNAMRFSVFQDGMTSWIIAVFFGMIPMIMVDRVGMGTSSLSFMIFYGGFVAIGASYFFHQENSHLSACWEKRSSGGNEVQGIVSSEQALNALDKHIERHFLIASIVIFPISFVQLIESTIDDITNRKEFSESMWITYLGVRMKRKLHEEEAESAAGLGDSRDDSG